jgi:molybdopterin molybdotransferase
LLNSAKVTRSTQWLGLDDALNKILAVDLYADIFVPSFDNSAMDGYALNLKAEQINISGGTTFKITDRIPAGSTGNTLASGCAARLFTGAPIPKGANTVVMQEECELIENASRIEIYRPIALNENIRPMGNDRRNAVGDFECRSTWYIYLFCFKINGVTIHSGIVKTRDKNISIQINS